MFYELALHFNPHCAEACNNLGVIYKDRDNLDKAVECYQVCFYYISVHMSVGYFFLVIFLLFNDHHSVYVLSQNVRV